MSARVDAVEQKILDGIVAGTYRRGNVLPNEADLAASLQVSRLTVREAIRALAARGIVYSRQGSGTYVVEPERWVDLAGLVMLERRHRDEVDLGLGLLEVRRMLEVGTAGLAAARRTQAQLEAMEQANTALRKAHRSNDVDGAVDADLEFHDVLIRAGGNPFVVATYAPLRDELARARRVTSMHPGVREHAIMQHERILHALRIGSPDAAKAAMRAHMEQTSNDLLAWRDASSQGGGTLI